MKLTLIVLLTLPSYIFSQSLNTERINKIKNATVRVIVYDGSSVGTGFFINSKGDIATCWHVIQPALTPLGVKTIFIQLNNEDTMSVTIDTALINSIKPYQKAIGYDYCILKPTRVLKNKITYLKLGNFDNILEGQEVYTCGYPFGFSNQFISKGIVSSKYIEKGNWVQVNGDTAKLPRHQALLDLTLNKGNSGGPIIKIGKSSDNDEVIGIADFIINPVSLISDSVKDELNNLRLLEGNVKMNVLTDATGKEITSNDPNKIDTQLFDMIQNTSNGISGCISINHLIEALKKNEKEDNVKNLK